MFLQDNPIGPGDRVLAGLSVAFDASCEEMWLAWRNGACLVPAPRSLVRSGMDLGPWLVSAGHHGGVDGADAGRAVARRGAGGGAAADLRRRGLPAGARGAAGRRSRRRGREVWNTYGPTEATVVACAARLDGIGPVSIGLPLPGWDLAVVDKDGTPVAVGEVGELVIGGVGLARYLDPEKDAEKYAPMPTLGWDRAYRSGDLVRLEPDGLILLGPRRRPGQGRRPAHRTRRGRLRAGEPARRQRRRGRGAADRQRHSAAGRLHRQRRPVLRPRRGRARRWPSRCPPRWCRGWCSSTNCPPARRARSTATRCRGRRPANADDEAPRPRRHDGLAGRTVARRAGRAGRRARGGLLRPRRRLAVGGATGRRAARSATRR